MLHCASTTIGFFNSPTRLLEQEAAAERARARLEVSLEDLRETISSLDALSHRLGRRGSQLSVLRHDAKALREDVDALCGPLLSFETMCRSGPSSPGGAMSPSSASLLASLACKPAAAYTEADHKGTRTVGLSVEPRLHLEQGRGMAAEEKTSALPLLKLETTLPALSYFQCAPGVGTELLVVAAASPGRPPGLRHCGPAVSAVAPAPYAKRFLDFIASKMV